MLDVEIVKGSGWKVKGRGWKIAGGGPKVGSYIIPSTF
jgi:hypothetical protein